MNIFANDKVKSAALNPLMAEIQYAAESEARGDSTTEEQNISKSGVKNEPDGKASREFGDNNIIMEETEVYGIREETRDEFNRAAYEEKYTVGERGQIAYAYKVCRSVTENAKKTKEELRKLGIKGIIHEGLKSNSNGITTIYDAGASTFARVCVFIDNEIGRNPVETAGHEAFHYLVGTQCSRLRSSRLRMTDLTRHTRSFSNLNILKNTIEKHIGDRYENQGT